MNNNWRKGIFWFIDALKGSKVKSHYDDIKFQYEYFNNKESIHKRNKDLNSLLKFTCEKVNFYKNIDTSNGINSFPIINKSIIKENVNDFLAKDIKDKKSYPTTTSGSTGTPFTVYRDFNKVKRHQAENIFFQELAGYSLGSKLYYLRVWNEVNQKTFLKRVFQNIRTIEISNLSDDNIKNILSDLEKDNSESSILSFASSLEIIARFIERHNLKYKSNNVKSIITMSEPITSTD